jgi:hypothetical protein
MWGFTSLSTIDAKIFNLVTRLNKFNTSPTFLRKTLESTMTLGLFNFSNLWCCVLTTCSLHLETMVSIVIFMAFIFLSFNVQGGWYEPWTTLYEKINFIIISTSHIVVLWLSTNTTYQCVLRTIGKDLFLELGFWIQEYEVDKVRNNKPSAQWPLDNLKHIIDFSHNKICTKLWIKSSIEKHMNNK